MPFNLDDYEPVEDRLRAFWKDHPMGRIATEIIHDGDPDYIVKASIWRGFENIQSNPNVSVRMQEVLPGATGYAQEIPGSTPVNRTSALENCETSAIGRALANLGYAAKGKRPSREEMASASSSPAHRDNDPTQEPASTGASGRDGAVEDVAGDQPEARKLHGEVATSPAPATHTASTSIHGDRDHILKASKEHPGEKYCIIVVDGQRCDYTEGAS
jgi:hypothetical protein